MSIAIFILFCKIGEYMNNSTSYWLKKGIHNGMPIALGYLAVSFTLGIAAKNAGLTALQAALASITCHASAGKKRREYYSVWTPSYSAQDFITSR